MELSLTSALYLVGVIQSTYLLLVAPVQRGRPLLLLFLGATTLLIADYLVWANEWLSSSVQFWVNRFTHTSLTYVLGPCLYFYFRLNSEPDFRLRTAHLWHGLAYSLALPLSIFIFPRYLPMLALSTSTWWLPANTWPQVMRSVHVLFYAYLGCRLLWVHASQRISDTFRHLLTTSVLLTGSCSVLVGTGTYLLPDAYAWRTHWEATSVLFSVGMLYLLNRLLSEYQSNPSRFSSVLAANPLSEPVDLPDPVKYQHSALDPAAAAVLFRKLETYITDSRAYKDPDLTLPQLAQALHVSANQLSQAINQVGGQPFYELINRYRITAACHLLTDPVYQYLSVSGIGYEVGFRSKSTYYTAFRRKVGITPNAYRKQAAESRS